jgi:hypothetical protein
MLDVVKCGKVLLDVANLSVERVDVGGEVSQDRIRRQRPGSLVPVGMPKRHLDTMDLSIELAHLVLQNLVVVRQPSFADVVD